MPVYLPASVSVCLLVFLSKSAKGSTAQQYFVFLWGSTIHDNVSAWVTTIGLTPPPRAYSRALLDGFQDTTVEGQTVCFYWTSLTRARFRLCKIYSWHATTRSISQQLTEVMPLLPVQKISLQTQEIKWANWEYANISRQLPPRTYMRISRRSGVSYQVTSPQHDWIRFEST